jgi:hypothetical protein
MNRVEQYIQSVLIKKQLLEQNLLEKENSKKYEDNPEYDPHTGYLYKIPRTNIAGGDLQKLRAHFIDKAAQENGAERGFFVVAIHKDKTKKPTYEQMINAIVDRMAMDNALSGYYGYGYRIVVSVPKGTDRRKVFAVWIVNVSDESPLAKLLSKLESYTTTTTVRKISAQMNGIKNILKTEELPNISSLVMSQPVAINWTTSLNNLIASIKKEAPDWWANKFPKTREVDMMLSSVPNFKYMNRINVEKFQSKRGAEVQLGQLDVTPEILYTKYQLQSMFTGKAIIEADPISGRYSMIPLNGTGRFSFPTGCEENCRYGSFTGEYKSGAYYKGTLEFDLDNTEKDWDITKFIGTVESEIYEEFDETTDTYVSTFSFSFDDGDGYYHKSKTTVGMTDPYGYKFSGKFGGKFKPKDGVYYEREQPNAEYVARGEMKNGKYSEYLKPVTYPYTADNGSIIYTKDPDDQFVYTYAADEKKWYVALKADHAKLVNKTITNDEFISKLKTIEKPEDVQVLIDFFKVDLSEYGKQYVTIKSSITDFKVYKNEANKWIKFGSVKVTDTRKLEKLATKDKYTQVIIPGLTNDTQQTWVETSILE